MVSDEVSSNAPYGHRSAEATVFKNGHYVEHASYIDHCLLKLKIKPNISGPIIQF